MTIEAISARWFGHPRPIEGETFSSWFRRVAEANALPARDLYRAALPGSQLYTYDLDRHACGELLWMLSRHTGISEEAMRELMVDRWRSTITELLPSPAKLTWLPPAGRENSRRSFGQQVCGACLGTDPVPYLRASWRLGFVTVCELHGQLLMDRCPACSEPIQILTSLRVDGAITRCWNCDRDFRNAEPQAPENEVARSVQAKLLDVVKAGWIELGDYGPMHAILYFSILNRLFRLLLTGRHAYALRTTALPYCPDIPVLPSNLPRIKEAERLPPRSRGILVSLAWELTQRWPHRFIEACRATGITSRVLLKDPQRLPYALWHPVSTHLSDVTDAATPEEVLAARAILLGRGDAPTRNALRNLLGKKFDANAHHASPARQCVPYGTHRYWKLDGVSPAVRMAAKAAAKRQGENVGAWVSKTLARVLTEESRRANTKCR